MLFPVKHILLNIHLIASIVWVGAVFMGAFIDWPAARQSVPVAQFPFSFIVGQGRRVFYSVYTGIILLWLSGAGLVFLSPPRTTQQLVLVSIKALALTLMTAFTLHGTFSSWPKLQMATNQEAFAIYRIYMLKAYGTFTLGILASALGSFLTL